MLPMINKKGMETVWWVLLVIILMIVALLIFFIFIRTGMIQINTPLGNIFGGLQSIGNTT
jgi:uncharacterized integral membrane protein